jgi:hypothetical protein
MTIPAVCVKQVMERDRSVLGADVEPGQVSRDRRPQVEAPLVVELDEQDRGERLADGAVLEGRLGGDRPAGGQVCVAEGRRGDEAVAVGDGQGEAGKPADLEELLHEPAERVGRHGSGRYGLPVIDCDIHPQIGDPEELLAYVEPAQREWFRGQVYYGLPGYSWSHPSSWFRQDLAHDGRAPGSDVEAVAGELLDPASTSAS